MTRLSVLQYCWVCYWRPLPCNDVKPAVVAEEWTSTWVSVPILLPQQLAVPHVVWWSLYYGENCGFPPEQETIVYPTSKTVGSLLDQIYG